MFRVILSTTLLFSFCYAHAQNTTISPDWKPGDKWKVKAISIAPSDKEEMNMDTITSTFLWKVESVDENGNTMSLQLLDYDISNKDNSSFEREMYELILGLKNLPAILYEVKKDGTVFKTKIETSEDGDAMGSLFAMAKSSVVIPNDSVLYHYAKQWSWVDPEIAADTTEDYSDNIKIATEDETKERRKVNAIGGYEEPANPMVKPDRSASSVEKVEYVEEWDESDDDTDDSKDIDWSAKANESIVLEFISERIERLHTPFGTEIKAYGIQHDIKDISEQELSQLQMNKEVLEMLKIEGSYSFSADDNTFTMVSDLSFDMADMMRKLADAFEEAFKDLDEGDGQKKKGKKKKGDDQSKASEQIPSMAMKMKSTYSMDITSMIPLKYNMVVSTSVSEKGVNVSFEATDSITFEKAE
jgi:hypothetical protein